MVVEIIIDDGHGDDYIRCMIYYDGENECWRDTEDDGFNIPMTVEGISEWEDMEFSNKKEFWKWYFDDADAPVFNDYMSAMEWFHNK